MEAEASGGEAEAELGGGVCRAELGERCNGDVANADAGGVGVLGGMGTGAPVHRRKRGPPVTEVVYVRPRRACRDNPQQRQRLNL